MIVASVLIPLPVPEAFDYEVPEGLTAVRGDQVTVPLGPRLIRGVSPRCSRPRARTDG